MGRIKSFGTDELRLVITLVYLRNTGIKTHQKRKKEDHIYHQHASNGKAEVPDLRVELVEDGIRFLARDAVCFCKLICESEHLDTAGVPSWTRKIMPNVAQIGNTSSHLD